MKPQKVRVSDPNYISLKLEAVAERRSITAQLNQILDEHYQRTTVAPKESELESV